MPPFGTSLDFEKLVELEYTTFTAKVTLMVVNDGTF